MTAARVLKIVGAMIVAGMALFIFFLYATIKTKSTGIDKYPPFKEWVGKTVVLKQETIVFREKIKSNANSRYPYTLLDSLHPAWEYLERRKTVADPDIVEVSVFPAGTELVMEKAIQYTNGVSGSSYPTIFGTIGSGEETYKVGYQWGERDIGRSHRGVKECWQFHQAPWQADRDTAYYELPVAAWW